MREFRAKIREIVAYVTVILVIGEDMAYLMQDDVILVNAGGFLLIEDHLFVPTGHPESERARDWKRPGNQPDGFA
ncbi:hypothetical protein [Streptomyces sp. enrichment culture]|uniref:hypothetical protein n=1 Tax=Streptomyces sp. enrichment culture TaxID=1795815 RepID=UPI003F57B962